MENYGMFEQNNITLPHDVIKLPSKGIFYKPKKESLKVGYLTAADENLLVSQNIPKDGLILTLLKNKIYEPGFDVSQLIDVDVQSILLFLRNTSFGNEYVYRLTDPATQKTFDATVAVDEINFINKDIKPNDEGFFETTLPKSGNKILCKLLSIKETNEIEDFVKSYPSNMISPTITKRLEKQIVEIDGNRDMSQISKFITQMPIADSKYVRQFLKNVEPQIDLSKTVIAPSGEKVTFDVTFGVEFFRPFFEI
jgi:hypothetical protein